MADYCGWRAGGPIEVERDSLADRLICDPSLRAVVATGDTHPSGFDGWAGRVRKLAESTERSYADTLADVIRRATEHVGAA